ncbi:MAG: hypothetical protein NVS3B28_11450 [Candidatus Velthaea sp.]
MMKAVATRAHEWLATHRTTLDTARRTIRTRAFWSAYPEVPSGKIYGETANGDGKPAFEARLDDVVSGIVGAIDGEQKKPGVVRASTALDHPNFPGARIRTPLVLKVDAGEVERYDREMFGPIVFIIATDSTEQSLSLATGAAQRNGAITAILHSTSAQVIAAGERRAAEGTVSLAINLTGALVVNQSAAFSDFHVTGGNPSANASLTDAAFVANRFRVIETRRPATSAD